MNLWSPDRYLEAWSFAAFHHREQLVPGSNVPYATHLGSVAMEVMTAVAARGDVGDPDLAVQCALLHDVVEDAGVSLEQVKENFGEVVADGVAALTKDKRIFIGTNEDNPIPLDELEEKLKHNAKIQKEKEIFLHADRKLEYGFVIDVMAKIKNAGIDSLGMVTDPLETK